MFKRIVETPKYERIVFDKSQLHQIAVVDQTINKEFNLNPFGYVRNTIGALAHCQTIEQYNAIVASLQKIEPKFNLRPNKDGKIASYSKQELFDAYAMIRPRWCQMPNELDAFAAKLAQYDKNKINTAYEEYLENQVEALDAPAGPAAGGPSVPAE